MSAPWWAWVALVNLVIVLAALLWTHDELQFATEAARWIQWAVRGVLFLGAAVLGAAIVFLICASEWRVRRRTRELEARRP